jgi:hypothetical protein
MPSYRANIRGLRTLLMLAPAGAWLGIPIGAALFGFGFFGLDYMKDDTISAASDEDDAPSI